MFSTITEAALPLNTSHDALRGQLRDAVKASLGLTGDSWGYDSPWIMDVFPSNVVYQYKSETYKRGYTATQGSAGTAPSIKLTGDAKKVHVAYMDNKEAGKESKSVIMGDPEDVIITQESGDTTQIHESIDFTEAVVTEGAKPTTIPIKIIGPGWGSMAYYSKEVLQRDGPKVFRKGTHMMWNHATDTEESERPEGNLDNLAAVLMEDAVWQEAGVKGPGLYSKAKVFSDYSTQVEEKGPHIGVSINAGIKAHEGTVEGRTGKIADKFVVAYSTDFVTKAGAGGAPIVPVSESNRGAASGGTVMTDDEIKALEARAKASADETAVLKAKLEKLQEAQDLELAVATVSDVLKEAEIPFNEKLVRRACANPVMKEGKPDTDWVKTIVADFTDGQTGQVRGAGHSKESQSKDDKETEDKLKESLKALGVPEAGMASALGGR